MIEVMIPDFKWNQENWIIRKVESIENAFDVIKNCDGNVKNVLFDCNYANGINDALKEIFDNLKWVEKIIIKQENIFVGIFCKICRY
ncbi:hypothetical protein VLK81_05220 [Citroniella saccharovorans]|uniref:Uncharacterized protein n=1 Tax=Citroniella saccharovorans TaxID=2053367 RepID=A0AAW9MY43_9FIRM|nr:hypothetical protein [Citroniella saccharovorans]MEB3429419.1 hypothetical protein [Citroniella saccharovorans]